MPAVLQFTVRSILCFFAQICRLETSRRILTHVALTHMSLLTYTTGPLTFLFHLIFQCVDGDVKPTHSLTHSLTPTLSFILQLNIIFVFPVFIFKPFASSPYFHFTILLHRLSSLSAIKIKSSAYSNSRGKPVRSSLEIISITITNSRGLNADL